MTAPATTDDRLAVSVDEAARLLDISRDLAYDLIRRGELPAVKLGRRIVVPRHQLEILMRDERSRTKPISSLANRLERPTNFTS